MASQGEEEVFAVKGMDFGSCLRMGQGVQVSYCLFSRSDNFNSERSIRTGDEVGFVDPFFKFHF